MYLLHKVKDQKGFTLLEILIAGAILTIGLLGIAAMMTSAIHGNAFGGRMSIAENLAVQRIEYFKNLGHGSITREIGLTGGTYTTSGFSACGSGTATEDYGQMAGYTLFWRQTLVQFLDYTLPNTPSPVSDCNDTSRPKLITVTVRWKDTAAKNVDGTPKERSVIVKGVFAK